MQRLDVKFAWPTHFGCLFPALFPLIELPAYYNDCIFCWRQNVPHIFLKNSQSASCGDVSVSISGSHHSLLELFNNHVKHGSSVPGGIASLNLETKLRYTPIYCWGWWQFSHQVIWLNIRETFIVRHLLDTKWSGSIEAVYGMSPNRYWDLCNLVLGSINLVLCSRGLKQSIRLVSCYSCIRQQHPIK